MYSFAFLAKDDFNTIDSIKKQNIETELSFVSLAQLALERQESGNLIEIGDYKFSSTLIIDNNWEIYFAIWPEDSSMAVKTIWHEAELTRGVVYDYKDTKFNITLEDGIISIGYDETGSKFISKISYDDILHKLYSNAEKISFADMVEYALIRNHDPLNNKDGIITLRLDRDGMFWYSFNLDDIIAHQIKWLVGINGVLYGMKISDDKLFFFSKPVDMDKGIYGREKLLKY
ncbi:MAG: hypothetical protein KKD35_06360 [Elusimicrobia bacterium]|nr:hypothetical protein [Elusimicrobiota bacterium]